ncbi:STAS domain-containing protein [Curvibacter sp. APW13]|uniref:STAS domain-containing protein n=1 Tax=Curvibacter sp. APW13 TaxID=3077236 RepID=UPI0028DF05FE|nr:STAS domain-containing protein [Curvibacter sp. APW13]MDT8990106.1 STAS domain-containing protein [Curvibacter sp. APW13]
MGKKFDLPSEWNIYTALESRDALLAWAAEQGAKGHDRLEISAAQVAEIDGAGLQLLAALGNQEISWRLVDASEVFIDACKTLGFKQWLESLDSQQAGV